MRYLAVIQPLPGGRYRGTIPDIPEILVEAGNSFEVERRLPRAVEAYLDETKVTPKPGARWANIIAYTRRYRDLRRPKPKLPLEDMKRIREKLDELFKEPLPGELVNAAFRYRSELNSAILEIEPREMPPIDMSRFCGFSIPCEELGIAREPFRLHLVPAEDE